MGIRWATPLAAFVALAFIALASTIPSLTRANNVGSAATTSVGGRVSLTIPPDGHKVYRFSLREGDWLIGYAMASGTHKARGSIRVLDPSATDVASDTVATSSSGGVLFWQAPTTGSYYCDFTATPGTVISRGLFVSRPRLSSGTARRIVVPYNGSTVLSCRMSDALYTYIAYDGPVVPFESVRLSSSHDQTPTPIYWGATDVNGRISHRVSHLTRKTNFVFDYTGGVYDMAAFGEARATTVTVIPQVRITQYVPKREKRGVAFTFAAKLQPGCPDGPTDITAQARKKGGRDTLSFAANASVNSKGVTTIRSSVTLPSAGTWFVRFHHPEDSDNADTVSKWGQVVVR